MEYIVEIENVTKRYHSKDAPDVIALNNISLCIPKGEFLAVCGVSGSGKSTLLHLIGCLDKPTEGRIALDGIDTTKLSDKQMAQMRNRVVSVVLQDFGLIPYRTVYDNIAVPLYFSKEKKEKKKRIEDAMKVTELSALSKRLVSHLSGGQKQRVAIARAIVNNAPILLADEPTGQLDYKTTKEIADLFMRLNRDGETIIMVTHNLELAKIADRTIYISDGRITSES